MTATRRAGQRIVEGEPDPHAESLVSSPVPVTVVVADGRVCVAVMEEPRREITWGACRCGGCLASQHADLAERFLP